jgi:uncharacterized membrane protein YbjE (DUF340 family)
MLVSTAAFSQTVIERPIPFDGSGKVSVITRAMRDQLKLFPDVRDFTRAYLLQSDTAFVLEITLANGDRQRYALSAEERDNLQQQIEQQLTATPSAALNQKGRGLFLISQLPMAMAWYSPAVLAITKPNDPTIGVATYMISASGFFFVPLLMTRNVPMTEAQATMSVDYGYYGVLDGFCLTDLLGMGNLFSTDDASGQGRAAVMLATSIGGQFLGYQLGRPYSLGQARYASLVTDCGIVDGLMLSTFFQTFRDNDLNGNSKLNSAFMLVGTGAAGYLAHRLVRNQSWTEGQAIVTGLGSLFGPVVANGAFWTVAPNSASDHLFNYGSFLALAGNVAGTWYAQRLVREIPITNSGAFIATGTTLGTGLLGAGIGFLISNTSNTDPEAWRWITGFGTAGVAGGFLLGTRLARDVTKSAQFQSNFRFNLDLASIAAGAVTYTTSRRFSAPRLITFSF